MKYLFGLVTLALLWSAPANAASRVWIAECNTLGATNTANNAAQVCMIPFLADSGPIDISAGAGSVTMTNKTTLVRVCVEQQTAFRGAAGVTTSNSIIFAGQCEYFGVVPSSVISVILEP